jgi:sensor c-di-GMP phosphodiesterase-like protein
MTNEDMHNTIELVKLLWIPLAGFVGVVASILWLWIAWRAMKAHERLARAAEQIAQASTRPNSIAPL